MRLLFLLLVICFSSTKNFSQASFYISGRIIDAQTKKPVPFATVFLARTSIGMVTNEDGTFNLESIPQGKYDFTVSMLGYERFSKSIDLSEKSVNNYIVELKTTEVELESVTVTGHKEKWNPTLYSKFEKIFLGQTANAFHCKVINQRDIFSYNEKEKLIAISKKPIEVLNQALGYKIFYDLKQFEADFENDRLTMSGEIRFEELVPANGKQKAKWLKERDRAYYGSIEHFLRSLLNHQLTENYFSIIGPNGNILHEEDILKNDSIRFSGQLNVKFSKELPENLNMQRRQDRDGRQQSEVIFNGSPIKIYQNGYFEDFHNVVFLGYFQLGNVAEMVPLGYVPYQGLSKK
ncbi:MAG TPA: hypothetical protein DGG95_11060 [Cytophagales bacterium]|jgi:hypothetical protein|nr:hypothetical protein [Cytophagales bacterium]